MELYVFNKELNFIGVVEGYTSLRWIRRYNKCGEFELTTPLTEESLSLLQMGNIISKKSDKEAAYIESRNLKQNIDGSETLVLRGKFLSAYLGRRIIWNTENFNGPLEMAIRDLITRNVINPVNVKRKIEFLKLSEIKNLSPKVNYQVSYKNLMEEIENLCNTESIGFRTLMDASNRKILFDLYEGLDRSVSQESNPRAIFAKEFENVLEQDYTESINNFANVNLIAGAGEGTVRKLLEIGTGEGVDRFEIFTDARDLSDESISSTEYLKILEQRGNEKLAEYKEIKTFDSKINIKSNLDYRTDFDLGDIVTCKSKKWGITIDARITEIEEVYETTGFTVNAVFGNHIPTLIDKIKQNIR